MCSHGFLLDGNCPRLLVLAANRQSDVVEVCVSADDQDRGAARSRLALFLSNFAVLATRPSKSIPPTMSIYVLGGGKRSSRIRRCQHLIIKPNRRSTMSHPMSTAATAAVS